MYVYIYMHVHIHAKSSLPKLFLALKVEVALK